MDGVMRQPRAVHIETDLPVPMASARLAQSLVDRLRIEPGGNLSSDRRLTGHVDGTLVHLDVWDANVLTRRKSWNVEFDGAFESAATGAVLKGSIDIPDRAQLTAILLMLRIAAMLVPILALGLEMRDLSRGEALVLWPAVGAILLSVFVMLAVRRVKTEGERHADDDARALTTAVDRLLRE